ncbi:MAG TPA: hypothetical protein PLQ78_07960 [Flavipsychrobacter sp.]|nr:hypothetical protein [Flavipsychrobacter sp.]
MKKYLFLLVFTIANSIGNTNAQHVIYLTIPDTSIISDVSIAGKPIFTIHGINNIINQYTVTNFCQAFPHSRIFTTRQVYKLTTNSPDLSDLVRQIHFR